MRPRILLAAACAALLCTGGAKKPVIDLRVHGQANAAEAPTFAFPATMLNGEPTFLQRMPLLTDREVKAIYPFPAADGSMGVYLKLDSHGTGLLQQYTQERPGRKLVVILNGRQISNLLVDRPVKDGILSVSKGLTPDDVDVLASVFPVLGQPGQTKKKGT